MSGFYALGVTGNNIFSHNKRRINYTVMFASAPRSFWGIGYDAGRYNPESTYSEKRYLVEGRYLHEFPAPRLHRRTGELRACAGAEIFQTRPTSQAETALYGHGRRRNSGIRLAGLHPQPVPGVYVSFQETLFPKGLGNCGKTQWRTTFTADAYGQVWKGGVLAADLYAVFNSDGTPGPMLARMGGGQRMRGYYQAAIRTTT